MSSNSSSAAVLDSATTAVKDKTADVIEAVRGAASEVAEKGRRARKQAKADAKRRKKDAEAEAKRAKKEAKKAKRRGSKKIADAIDDTSDAAGKKSKSHKGRNSVLVILVVGGGAYAASKVLRSPK